MAEDASRADGEGGALEALRFAQGAVVTDVEVVAVGAGRAVGAGLSVLQEHIPRRALSTRDRVFALVAVRNTVRASAVRQRVPTHWAVRHAGVAVEELSIEALVAADVPIAAFAPADAGGA